MVYYPDTAGPVMFPLLGGGEAIFNPWLCDQNDINLTSGVMQLVFGAAQRTEEIGHIATATGGAGATLTTFAAYGLYTVSPAYNLTRVAQTVTDTGLWSVEFQSYNGIDVAKPLTAQYQKLAGQLYAIGLLWVGTGVQPAVVGGSGWAGDNGSSFAAGMSAAVTGLASLPASVSYGSLSAAALAPCAVTLP